MKSLSCQPISSVSRHAITPIWDHGGTPPNPNTAVDAPKNGRRTYVHTEGKSPHSAGLCPLSGLLPKKEERKERRKEGRKKGKKEGRKEGRKEERKKGRKEGRKESLDYLLLSLNSTSNDKQSERVRIGKKI